MQLLIFLRILLKNAVPAVLENVLTQKITGLSFAQLLKRRVRAHLDLEKFDFVLTHWRSIKDIHRQFTPRESKSFRFKLILKQHDLGCGGSRARIKLETEVKDGVNKWIVDFHVTNSHVLDISLGLRRISTVKWVLLNHEVVQTTPERPNVDR